jgi:putative spermidine/putrescine transport system substrate-binding protein
MTSLRSLLAALCLLAPSLAPSAARAFDGPELYPGERALYEAAAREGIVISNNTGPTWANWGALFRAFGQRYPEVTLVYNDVGSGVAVNALDRTRGKPQVDTVYYFGPSGIDAASRGLLAPFKPVNFDKLPAAFREQDGLWFAVHQLSVVFIVNKKLVKTVPRSWADLKKPDYKAQVVYFDPRTSGVGQVTAFAANFAAGGSMETVQPGLDYLTELHRAGNVLRVETNTPYARFLKGEVPIWISFENDGLRARHVDGMGDDVEIVVPAEGTVAAPYTISLVKGAKDENAAKLWLNFILSDQGQRLFADGLVRPVTGVSLPAELTQKLPAMPKVELLEPLKAAMRKPDIDRGWARQVLGN